jgi:hypothetical protein
MKRTDALQTATDELKAAMSELEQQRADAWLSPHARARREAAQPASAPAHSREWIDAWFRENSALPQPSTPPGLADLKARLAEHELERRDAWKPKAGVR